MSGFMSSTTAITICKVNSTVNFTLDALRTHAFTPDIDADGRRLGWVALGDPLDTDGFELASVDGRYSGFSFRLDTRKASAFWTGGGAGYGAGAFSLRCGHSCPRRFLW